VTSAARGVTRRAASDRTRQSGSPNPSSGGSFFAGYVAMKMGVPIDRLVIATNANDILARTLATGSYEPRDVVPTSSPSMDIQVSSNFERLLFDAYGRDARAVRTLMDSLAQSRRFTVAGRALDLERSGRVPAGSEIKLIGLVDELGDTRQVGLGNGRRGCLQLQSRQKVFQRLRSRAQHFTLGFAAILLGALMGIDGRDTATRASKKYAQQDYTSLLDRNGLKGARIGVARQMAGNPPSPAIAPQLPQTLVFETLAWSPELVCSSTTSVNGMYFASSS
jgi:hypothetical protein